MCACGHNIQLIPSVNVCLYFCINIGSEGMLSYTFSVYGFTLRLRHSVYYLVSTCFVYRLHLCLQLLLSYHIYCMHINILNT